MKRSLFFTILVLLMLLGGYFRGSGLFHGLEEGVVFHPDTPKQVHNLNRGLSGIYVSYHNSLFYDGYPYGLNRLDEILIRAALIPIHATQALFYGVNAPRWRPSVLELYYIARFLRFVYGVLALVLITATAHVLTRNRLTVLAVCAFAAVAPLASTVTHSASGDIGLDLFLSATIFCLALHNRSPRARWLVLAGLTVGMAFAAKYQGALGAWMVAVYLFLNLLTTRGSFTGFLRAGLVSSLAFFGGALLLTPAFWVDAKTTWRLMGENFVFIKNYNVPEEFMELPARARAVIGLRRNIPPMVEALGPFLLLGAVISLSLALLSWWRSGREREAGPCQEPAFSSLWVACASFPFVVLLLSTAMKPVVQPFHFSFVVYPLALSAGLMLHALHGRSSRKHYVLLAAYALLVTVNGLHVSLREDFFWRRPSMIAVSNRYILASGVDPLHQTWDFSRQDVIKRFHLHEYGLPVFRNRSRAVADPDAAWWQAHQQLTVPTLPLFDNIPGWIFMNGARFPLSDRAFRIPGGEGGTTRLVFEGEVPGELALGIRSGQTPAWLRVTHGPHGFSEFFAPHSQKILPLNVPLSARRNRAYRDHPETFVVELNLESSPGDLWVEILQGSRQQLLFELFGPQEEAHVTHLDRMEQRILSSARYAGEDTILLLDLEPQRLGGQTHTLPAGTFALNLIVTNPHPGPVPVLMEWRDPAGIHEYLFSEILEIPSGTHSVTREVDKAFEPFEVEILLEPGEAGMVLHHWSLRPAGIQNISVSPSPAVFTGMPLDIAFDHGIALKGFHLAFSEEPTGAVELAVLAEFPDTLSLRVFRETVLFVHLLRPDGSLFQALDIPFQQLSFSETSVRTHRFDLEPGHEDLAAITLRFGLYTPRNRIRFRPEIRFPEDLRERERRRAMDLHRFDAPFSGQSLPSAPPQIP